MSWSRWDRRGREALSEGRVVSRDPPEWPGRVGRPSWRAGMGREALLECRDGSGVPPRGIGVPRGAERDGRGQEDLQ